VLNRASTEPLQLSSCLVCCTHASFLLSLSKAWLTCLCLRWQLVLLQGVQKLVDAGGLSMAGSGVDDIFKMAVVRQKVVLSQLYNGQQLTAANGNTLTVKITT
jgi:hypothetical protein